MERFDIRTLTPGQSLSVDTESGSRYTLTPVTLPKNVGANLFPGFRLTRESRREVGQKADGELRVTHESLHGSIMLRTSEEGILKSGRSFEVLPGIKEDGKVEDFSHFITSKVVDIELIELTDENNSC